MGSARKLDELEVARGLQTLDGWALRGDKLHKVFRFPDFVQAFGFMTSCAIRAEAMGHHPEWSNVYSVVEVLLTTHDAEGLTALDFELAEKMDALARGSGA